MPGDFSLAYLFTYDLGQTLVYLFTLISDELDVLAQLILGLLG